MRSGAAPPNPPSSPTTNSPPLPTTSPQPARSRACVAVYRTFVLREQLPLIRGTYESARLRTPTHLLVGDSDPVITPALIAGYEQHADAMTTEIVPNCSHFIADEYPDLVAERARELFS